MTTRALPFVLLALALAACSKDRGLPAPSLSSVEPSTGRAGREHAVDLHGENFFLRLQRKIGGEATVDDTFQAFLGDRELSGVRRQDDQTLNAIIPSDLAPGRYPITVDRAGIRSTLEDAFEVTPAETNCSNAQDEDDDGLIDCIDPDCFGDRCDDGDPCTENDVCGASGTCRGSTLSCPDNGPCQAGACDAGSCVLLARLDGPCDDGVACSFDDRCDPTGTCVGTSYACVGTPCEVGSCLGDGGCGFTTLPPGSTCGTSGTCLEDGGCRGNGPFPFVPSNYVPDAFPAPTEELVVDNCVAALDTTSDTWVLPCTSVPVLPTPKRIILSDGTEASLILLKSLAVHANSSLYFIGSRPLVLAVLGDATIDGNLFVNSSSSSYLGAGGNPLACGASTGLKGTSPVGGAGGGGLVGAGGRGGGGTGGDGGVAVAALPLEPLRGGCAGADGAQGGARGGAGGGAFELSVSGNLIINGWITVSGAAGQGSNASSTGGAGGGSGGMLIIEAKSLSVSSSARLTANGGGGGGGAGGGANRQGTDGVNGLVDGGMQADGGLGGGTTQPGGNGGLGGSAVGAATAGATAAVNGSGGGGGGVGAVILRSTPGNCAISAGTTSPLPTLINCP